jgi:hypothetical protein
MLTKEQRPCTVQMKEEALSNPSMGYLENWPLQLVNQARKLFRMKI